MKTTNTISGSIFIIPNASVTASIEKPKQNFHFWSDLEAIWNTLVFHDNLIDKNKSFYDESWIQVWYLTPGNDRSNWTDHMIDGFEELEGWEPLCSYLPKSLFDGKKEGDVVTFTLPICRKAWRNTHDRDNTRIEYDRVKVSMTLAQLKYRYKNFGPFEEVLKRV